MRMAGGVSSISPRPACRGAHAAAPDGPRSAPGASSVNKKHNERKGLINRARVVAEPIRRLIAPSS